MSKMDCFFLAKITKQAFKTITFDAAIIARKSTGFPSSPNAIGLSSEMMDPRLFLLPLKMKELQIGMAATVE
jgi:hypothetical protein